jgi:hypothetical protein
VISIDTNALVDASQSFFSQANDGNILIEASKHFHPSGSRLVFDDDDAENDVNIQHV